MMTAGLFGLTALLVATLPLCVCAALARRDALRNQRRFGQRIFFTALIASGMFGALVLLAFFAIISRRPLPPNVGVGVAWGGVLFSCGFVFLASAFTGAIGYAISYRMFDRGTLTPTDPVIDENTRGEETGNPYQPPTI